jgi:hypothetical protein
MGKTIEDLKEICKQTNTSFSGIEKLIEYYEKSLHWSKDEAIAYAIGLFNNGTIDKIKVLGQDEKRNQIEEAKVNATTIKY